MASTKMARNKKLRIRKEREKLENLTIEQRIWLEQKEINKNSFENCEKLVKIMNNGQD